MPKIDTIVLSAKNPQEQNEFHRDVLGMSYDPTRDSLSYSPQEASLRFIPADKSYQSSKRDLYWKVSIAVPNIELACEQLMARGINLEDPQQFQEIGYLTHLRDPAGYSIEIIEHWFKGGRREEDLRPDQLGGGAHLNLLTLRTVNIDEVKMQVLAWGMKALSVQEVKNYGFTLYFFAFTEDDPPCPDLKSIENREWLYQRPYTVLEVQHLHEAGQSIKPADGECGYIESRFSGVAREAQTKNSLHIRFSDP